MTPPIAQHRKDIDGLRALAVLGVFLFHLDLGALPGGFVGVDVFFVISGYLVTSLLLRDIEKDRFAIGEFLFRRVKRIVPALVVVLAATMLAASAILMPQNMAEAAQSALAALFFVSNLYFWKSVNYFSGDTDLYPLLHTWSLGVEWQFYLALPITFFVLMRLGLRNPRAPTVIALFAAATLGSFALNAILVIDKPTGTYYFPATRFWEIMAGSMLALIAWRPVIGRNMRAAMAVIGFMLIFASMALFDRQTVFPGFAALIPVAGAMLLLVAGEGDSGLAGKALANPLAGWIGLISYSFYLWHWPVIVLYKYAVLRMIGMGDVAIITAIVLTLSMLSYRYVEVPCRETANWRGLASGWSARIAMACLALAVVAAGISVMRDRALQTSSQQMLAYLSKDYEQEVTGAYGMGQCFLRHDGVQSLPADCLKTVGDRPVIALVGDSHAAHLLPGLKKSFPGAQILQATVTGCRALLDRNTAAGTTCPDMRGKVFSQFIETTRPDLFILAGRWDMDDMADLKPTLDRLRENGQNVVLVGPVIEYLDALPSLLIRLDDKAGANLGKLDQLRRQQVFAVDKRMREIASGEGVAYVSSVDKICPDGACRVFAGKGVPLSWDYGHYTPEASVEIVQSAYTELSRQLAEGRKADAGKTASVQR